MNDTVRLEWAKQALTKILLAKTREEAQQIAFDQIAKIALDESKTGKPILGFFKRVHG